MRYYQEAPVPYISQYIPKPLEFMYNAAEAANKERQANNALLAELEFKTFPTNKVQIGAKVYKIKEYEKAAANLTNKHINEYSNNELKYEVANLKRMYKNDPDILLLEQNAKDEKIHEKWQLKQGKNYNPANDPYSQYIKYTKEPFWSKDENGKLKIEPMNFEPGPVNVDILEVYRKEG